MACTVLVSLLLIASLATSNQQRPFFAPSHSGTLDDIDIVTGSAFNGLTTFANLPYANCFADDDLKLDIAFLGAGFDTVRSWSSILTPFHPFGPHDVQLRNWLLSL